MYLSNFWELAILGSFRGVSAQVPAMPYIELLASDPGEDGSNANPIIYEGLTRAPFVATVPAPLTGIANSIGFLNQDEIKFTEAPADQGRATYIRIMDSLAGGNMMAYGQLSAPKEIKAGQSPTIRTGEIRMWFASANTTVAMKTRMLNTFRNIRMDAITPYASLANGDVELSGGNFARVPIEFAAPVLLATGAHEMASNGNINFAIASASLGPYDTGCIYDAESGGTKLITASIGAHTYAAGDDAGFDAGQLKFSLN